MLRVAWKQLRLYLSVCRGATGVGSRRWLTHLFTSESTAAALAHSEGALSPASDEAHVWVKCLTLSLPRVCVCVCLSALFSHSYRIHLWRWTMRDLSSGPTAHRTISFPVGWFRGFGLTKRGRQSLLVIGSSLSPVFWIFQLNWFIFLISIITFDQNFYITTLMED